MLIRREILKYKFLDVIRKFDAAISAAYFLYDFPKLRRYWRPIARLCIKGVLGLQEDLRIYLCWNGWHQGVQPGRNYIQVYFSYTGSMIYPVKDY